MYPHMALGTDRDQVLFRVMARLPAELLVVDLEVLG